MARFGLIEDYDYNATHKRKRFTIWSGPFASVREGEMYSLPNGKGFMITLEYGDKIRVECPVERTNTTYIEQDKAINDALNAYYDEHYGPSLVPESGDSGCDCGEADSDAPGHHSLTGPVEVARKFVREYSPNGKAVIRKR